MRIDNVKDLKDYLATLPAEADTWGINFIENDEDGGMAAIGSVTTGHWGDDPGEVPEGCDPGSPFIVLSSLPIGE